MHIALQYFAANSGIGCTLTTGHGDTRNYTLQTNGSGSYSGDQTFYYGFHDWVKVTCGGASDTVNPW